MKLTTTNQVAEIKVCVLMGWLQKEVIIAVYMYSMYKYSKIKKEYKKDFVTLCIVTSPFISEVSHYHLLNSEGCELLLC